MAPVCGHKPAGPPGSRRNQLKSESWSRPRAGSSAGVIHSERAAIENGGNDL
jgi:hypothetical protein